MLSDLGIKGAILQVFYSLLPILIPAGLSFVIIKFISASRTSRKRIRGLENDASYKEKLIHILSTIEHEVENAIVDIIDEGDSYPNPPKTDEKAANIAIRDKNLYPVLTDDQKKIAGWLNGLPGLKKELALFENIGNSHAIIVSRDLKQYKIHELGESVIRHWADSLII